MVQSLGEIHNYKIVMRVNEEPHRRTDPTVKLVLGFLGTFHVNGTKHGFKNVQLKDRFPGSFI